MLLLLVHEDDSAVLWCDLYTVAIIDADIDGFEEYTETSSFGKDTCNIILTAIKLLAYCPVLRTNQYVIRISKC